MDEDMRKQAGCNKYQILLACLQSNFRRCDEKENEYLKEVFYEKI